MNYVLFSTIAQGHFYYNGKTASKFFEAAFSLCHMCFLSLKSFATYTTAPKKKA
jgi:hypothetical protein